MVGIRHPFVAGTLVKCRGFYAGEGAVNLPLGTKPLGVRRQRHDANWQRLTQRSIAEVGQRNDAPRVTGQLLNPRGRCSHRVDRRQMTMGFDKRLMEDRRRRAAEQEAAARRAA